MSTGIFERRAVDVALRELLSSPRAEVGGP
jgi:hypothetical protein